MKPNRPLIVILSTVALDAVGIGLIMPVLPGLLRDLVHSNDVTAHYGILLALYALMQFACAPVLGALSDRFGRRPVLLVSLAGAAVDYAIMATAPFLWVLYIGRIVAGITGATGAVAGAYIADITDGDERARHFGFMSACFGFGMVAGPVLGGLMGGFSPHAPFFAAAALNGLNFLTGCFLLPESHKGERRPLRREALNPLASFRWARGMTVVAALMAVFFIMQLVGQVPAALWVIFGEDRFHWDATTIGISLAAFGILHSLAQAMITGPVAARLGERRALMLGMIADGTGYILLAFATRGWMAFPIMVLLASGGIGMPALQAMLSRQVDEERQGQLQGSLAALTSLTSIVGPLLFTAIYAASITTWNGWAWIAGAASRALERRRATSRSLIEVYSGFVPFRNRQHDLLHMLAAIVYHRPQQHTGDPSASLFGLHENAGQMRLVSVLGAVLLFEDRQPNDLAVDVGAECHGISQPFSERLHGLFLLVLVNGPEHLWSFLQGRQSDLAEILHVGRSKPSNLSLNHNCQF